MSLSTRRAKYRPAHPAEPPGVSHFSCFQAAEGKYEREAKLVAQLPEAAPFTKHGSVPCRAALDHARPHAPCFRRRRG